MVHWVRAHSWLLGVLAIASFAMLFQLDARPIENWDEGIHGEVSLEMVERGDWFTPHYMGGSYFRKPPLKIWMSAALFEWFGVNPWTLRLPSALAGIATSLLVAWWMWEWRRSRWQAFLAGAIIATMRPIFFHAFRTGEMDGLLAFFIVLALYGWWRRWPIPTGIAIGLAVMTKSAAGLLPLPIIAVDWFFHRRDARISFRALAQATLAFAVIVLPWHLAMSWLHGMAFWNDYLGWHVVKRATEALHNEGAGTWWYVRIFARRFTPYTYWFVPALLFSFFSLTSRNWLTDADVGRGCHPADRKAREAGTVGRWPSAGATERVRSGGAPTSASAPNSATSLLLTWFLLGFLLFSLIKTKLDWYLLPLYPAAVMLIVWFLGEVWAMLRSRVFRAEYVAALALVLTVGGAITTRHLLRHEPPNPFTDIAAAIRGSGGILVAYDLDYRQEPAGYFILRATLQDDVRILDGQSDVRRTLTMLAVPDRAAFLLTRNETELPEELRQWVDRPQSVSAFTWWRRQ